MHLFFCHFGLTFCIYRWKEVDEVDDDKVIIVDGIRYEKHSKRTWLFGYPIGEEYCPIAEDDPFIFLIITFIGGLFGIHKFMTGEWGKGIFYLLTCGGFGVFYCCDVLSILLGTYSIRQIEYEEAEGKITKKVIRIYLAKIDRKKLFYGIAMFVLSVVIAIGAYSKVYIPALGKLGTKMVINVEEGL